MDAQGTQVLEKTASAACADMCDDIDTIIEMEKPHPEREKDEFGYATHSVYKAKGKFVLPPDFLRTALHNTSTAWPTCEHNINNSRRELSYCSCPLCQSFSRHKSMASLFIQAGQILKCFLVTVGSEQKVQGNEQNLIS